MASLLLGITPTVSSAADDAHPDTNQDRKAEAGKLLDEGVALFESGKFIEAHDRFQKAYQAYSSPKILINIGRTLKELGRHVEAAEAYQQFLVQAASIKDPGGELGAGARAALTELIPRVARVLVSVVPPGAVLGFDGRNLGASSAPRVIYTSPGSHTVSASLEGFAAKSDTVSVAAGLEAHVDLKLEPATPAPPRSLALALGAATVSPSQAVPFWKRYPYALTSAGASAALLAGGLVVYLRARTLYDEFKTTKDAARKDDLKSEINAKTVVFNSLFVGAGVAGAAAVVLTFIEGSTGAAANSDRRVVLVPTAGGAVGAVAWRF